jgi:hypothetical protein
MSNDTTITLVPRSKATRVVIVQDDLRASLSLTERLKNCFNVRLAHSASDLPREMGPLDSQTCVIGVLSEAITARDVRETFVSLGGSPQRLVFISKEDLVATLDRVAQSLDPP